MLVDADVTYQEASYSFQPAFKAIGSKSSPLIPYQGCAFQTGIESDYLWIISNGSHLPDHDTICRKCYKTFQKAIAQSKYANWDLIDIMKYAYRALQAEKRKEIGESLWEQLLLTSHLYRPTISSKKGMICFGSIGELILYMRLTYGGAENYYRKEHLNGNMTYETYWSKISDLTLHRNHYYWYCELPKILTLEVAFRGTKRLKNGYFLDFWGVCGTIYPRVKITLGWRVNKCTTHMFWKFLEKLQKWQRKTYKKIKQTQSHCSLWF